MYRDILCNEASSQNEQMRLLRQFELQAYTSVINAFSAQGELTDRKRKLLKELQASLCIPVERHKAEIRRALNDDVIELASKAYGETRSEWIIEGKRSVPVKRRTIPDIYATRVAHSKTKMVLERPDLLRPRYKFFSKQNSFKSKSDTGDHYVDAETASGMLENGGETSTIEDDTESATGHEMHPSNASCKSDTEQTSNINDVHKSDSLKQDELAVYDQETIPSLIPYSGKEQKQIVLPLTSATEESSAEESNKLHIARPCVTTTSEPKPVISTVQSLYGKSVVFKPNVDQLSSMNSCLPNIKQVASTVTIGTSETSDAPVSSAPTSVSLQQSNLNLLKRQTNIIVVHRPSKISQPPRIAIPQQSNSRSIRVIRQDVPLSSGQQVHTSSLTESRIGLNVSNPTPTHNFSNVLNVDIDSDTPTIPTIQQQTQIKQKTYLPTQTQPQQPLQIQQQSQADVYHVPQASGEPRILTSHANMATYQKSDAIGYPSVELRKLDLQPVLRDQLQQTQKQQAPHQQQQLLVLQTHVPQAAQHQEQKSMPARFIYTQTPSQSLQRASSSPPPPASTQTQPQLQIQLQMQRQQQQQQQQQSAPSQPVVQAAQKQAMAQPSTVTHLPQQSTTQPQTQLIQQSQPQLQLQPQPQPQLQLQQSQSQLQLQQSQPQIQLQQSQGSIQIQPQPIMLAQQIKPQQYQLSQPQSQQSTITYEEQTGAKHTLPQSHQLKQESHQQQLLLLKGQLLQIQSISGEHSKGRTSVASLINESSLSPNKRLKTESANKRKLVESVGDWQAEVLPLISKLLDSCLLESPSTNMKKVDIEERGLIKQDVNPDNQESAFLLRMKDNLMSRQYLNQQTFENDMHQLQASCLKKCASDDNRREEIENLFSTFYRDLRILKQSSLETGEPPAKVKIYESG